MGLEPQPPFEFELLHVDKHTGARRSRLTTPHGVIELPTFMPVGTNATVKGLTTQMIEETGAQIILGNTYHLFLRPGPEIVESFGGLHKFMNWNRPILTDSGGFQIFSLAKLTKVDESGAVFRSHIDGSKIELTPERSVEIQESLGSDIAMVLDHLVELPSEPDRIKDACERTVRWAERCRKHATRSDQTLFAIVQGGLDPGLRKQNAEDLSTLDFFGYAVGGLSVGETSEEMYSTISATTPHLPVEKPRYLMGVGTPQDLVEAVGRGIDMFDCVMPTRNGRNALAFTDTGPLRMRNEKHKLDPAPLQTDMDTRYSGHSRGYLRHLFMAGEMLGPILLSFHNLAYYARLMEQAREAIEQDSFAEFRAQKMAGWGQPKNG